MTGRSLDYNTTDRDRHYLGTIKRERCPVCLVGMVLTHGTGPANEARLGAAWWRMPPVSK